MILLQIILSTLFVGSHGLEQTLMINYYNNTHCSNIVIHSDEYYFVGDCCDHYNSYEACCENILNNVELKKNQNTDTCYNLSDTVSYMYKCTKSGSIKNECDNITKQALFDVIMISFIVMLISFSVFVCYRQILINRSKKYKVLNNNNDNNSPPEYESIN